MGDTPHQIVPVADANPAQFANSTGATINPQYVERRPSMWAVGEIDLEALTLTTNIINGCFAIGSFCLGFAANILVSYLGVEKLTPAGEFMLHNGTTVAIIASVFFYVLGALLYWKRGSLWNKIKAESRIVKP